MQPVNSVEEAIHLVQQHTGAPHELKLPFPDSLNDPIGMNMALITDSVLARNWMPDGYVQKEGYRIYSYKEFE